MEGKTGRFFRKIIALDSRQLPLPLAVLAMVFNGHNSRGMVAFLGFSTVHLEDLGSVVCYMIGRKIQAELGDRGPEQDPADNQESQ